MSGEAPPVPAATASLDEAAVGAVLDDLHTFRHRYWAPALLGFIMLFDSWDSIAIAYVMPTLSAEWHLSPLVMGYIISAGYGGQFIGAVTLGMVAERLGRLPVFILATSVMCVLAIACAMATSYGQLFVLRAIQGVAIGGAMPVAITYVNELAPTRLRGRYFGLFQTLAISGFAVASLSSPIVVPHLGWRWMFGLGALPIVLLPLVWLTLPESPRWLARIGRLEQANRALTKLGGGPAAFTGGPASGAVTQKLNMNPLVLFKAPLTTRSIKITALWFLTMFTSFGLTTWVPSIYVKVFHIPVERALSIAAVTAVAIFLALATAGFMIDRFGRRPFAIGGLSITASTLLIFAAVQPETESVLVGLIMAGQIAMFYGAFLVWPLTAENYPTDVRALALGYGSSIGRGASMLTPIFVGFVLARGAPIAIVFGIFGLFALGAMLIWLLGTRETAGKPLDTI